ncbi:HD domain-containing protein [Albibacterium profundi]|uniref:HD domain-containing protein n=1 Tax=Albibacterium profundi TaxID=3134906 RepID=A0ABV5CDD3_9SPHI
MKKKKIINDPVYGFISLPSGLIYELIEHPYFQRLRNIKQVSLTHMVYPGALHTRFQHALGAVHLMGLAIETLRGKNVEISGEEEEAVTAAILLHDIGHGPFSHSLEHSIVEGVSHEYISGRIMDDLNKSFNGRLDLAIAIFRNAYSKTFLHQLVSSQLDTDRMDYLIRDSFYTGVTEGVISFNRIIKMLTVANNELVVEEKGIYSIEKFLIARRLMYWQVYLHKTVVSAEHMLIKILHRAKQLGLAGETLFATPPLQHFLNTRVTKESFEVDPLHLETFLKLDDVDILASMKVWSSHQDKTLSLLCRQLLSRRLNRVEIMNNRPDKDYLMRIKDAAMSYYSLSDDEVDYFVYYNIISNSAYDIGNESIKILMKDGALKDITEASDLSNLEVLSQKVEKYIVSFPKELHSKALI